MTSDEQDFYLDLLFHHRILRRLVAIELKLGRFDATYKGQRELYLRWLDRYERRNGEVPPIGLILCGERNQEQIELLENSLLHRKLAPTKSLLLPTNSRLLISVPE
jgi:hypothetical protein